MRRILFVVATALTVACSHAPPTIKLQLVEKALATRLSGSWDGGSGIDALIGELQPLAQAHVVPAVRKIADENSSDNALLKANARKWLAIKGYR